MPKWMLSTGFIVFTFFIPFGFILGLILIGMRSRNLTIKFYKELSFIYIVLNLILILASFIFYSGLNSKLYFFTYNLLLIVYIISLIISRRKPENKRLRSFPFSMSIVLFLVSSYLLNYSFKIMEGCGVSFAVCLIGMLAVGFTAIIWFLNIFSMITTWPLRNLIEE